MHQPNLFHVYNIFLKLWEALEPLGSKSLSLFIHLNFIAYFDSNFEAENAERMVAPFDGTKSPDFVSRLNVQHNNSWLLLK